MIKLHISRSGKDTLFEKEIYMDLLQAMRNRHSVRSYTNKPIEGEVKEKLSALIAQCNGESGLHIQLVLDEPNAFDSMMAHYGKFSGVRNYIVMAGKKTGRAGGDLRLLRRKDRALRADSGAEYLLGRHDLQ